MEQVTVINISWEKITFDPQFIYEKSSAADYGLYQVYGHHPSYGDDALLYIGRSDQLFSARLRERDEFTESTARPTSIRLGRIVQSKENESLGWEVNRWSEMIGVAERILIKAHTPAFNKQENSGIFSAKHDEFEGEQFLILNWEDYGKLLPEISTLRLSYKYWSFDKPLVQIKTDPQSI